MPDFTFETICGMEGDIDFYESCGILIPQEAHTVIYGAPKSGKSTFIARLCAEFSCHGSVLYIANEDRCGALARLDVAVKTFTGEIDNIRMISSIPLTNVDKIEDIIINIRNEYQRIWGEDEMLHIIVVDTLSSSMAGESEINSMGKYIHCIRRIINEFGCAVITIHHATKNDDTVLRGGGQLIGDADAIYRVSVNSSGLRKIAPQEFRTGKMPAPVFYKIASYEKDNVIPICDIFTSSSEIEKAVSISKHGQAIVDILKANKKKMLKKELIKNWVESGKVRARAYDGIKSAVEVGAINEDDTSLWLNA
jgi:RecA-family ATPase